MEIIFLQIEFDDPASYLIILDNLSCYCSIFHLSNRNITLQCVLGAVFLCSKRESNILGFLRDLQSEMDNRFETEYHFGTINSEKHGSFVTCYYYLSYYK